MKKTMTPLKVLIISAYADNSQGSNNNVHNISEALMRAGHMVFIATCKEPHLRRPGDALELNQEACEIDKKVLCVPCVLGEELKDLTEDEEKELQSIADMVVDVAKPDLIWMHHRAGVEWLYINTSSRTVSAYTVHDPEVICPKRTRVDDKGMLCTEAKSVDECISCMNRSQSRMGRVNQFMLKCGFRDFIRISRKLVYRLEGLRGWKTFETVSINRKVRNARDLNQKIIDNSNMILAPTKEICELIESQYYCRNRPFEMRWGLTDARKMLKRPRESLGRLKIAYIGRISREKGIHTMLMALEGLGGPEGIQANLDLWGTCSDKRYLERVSAIIRDIESGGGGIEISMRGWTNSVSEVMCESDILIIPSEWWENSPLVAVEASRVVGLHVVCSDIPGIGNILGGEENGTFIARMGDVESLKDALRKCIKSLSTKRKLKARSACFTAEEYVLRCLEQLGRLDE